MNSKLEIVDEGHAYGETNCSKNMFSETPNLMALELYYAMQNEGQSCPLLKYRQRIKKSMKKRLSSYCMLCESLT